MNENINATEFINYLIDNKLDIDVDATVSINFGNPDVIVLNYKPRKLRFEVGNMNTSTSNNKPVYYGHITKLSNNVDYNDGIHIQFDENDYKRLKETFIYTKDDLVTEVKSMLRGEKIDKILDKGKSDE